MIRPPRLAAPLHAALRTSVPWRSVHARRPATLHRFYSAEASRPGFTRRIPYKTISASVALTSVAYLYAQSLKFDMAHAEAEPGPPPMSAFSASSPAATLMELMDDENRIAVQRKATSDIALALFVYKLCTLPWLVDAAPHIIKAAETLHLQGPIYWFVKSTFFRHFCGGETPEECMSSMEKLARSGINCILDLSVEADLHVDSSQHNTDGQKWFVQEQHADVILNMTKNCISTAAKGQEQLFNMSSAFAAIKVTAFGPPELLLRLNQVFSRLDQAFVEHQHQGKVDAAGVQKVVVDVLPPAQSPEQEQLRQAVLSRVTSLDYLEFRKLFNLQGAARDLWWKTSAATKEKDALLTADELAAYDRMVNRLDEVCQLAHQLNVGIMIDAEQSYFQEAIDHVAMSLQQRYNRRDQGVERAPTVYNTYQMYTKAAQGKLELDVEQAKRENFAFAAKLVRGAYMVSERQRAIESGYPSPIQDSIEDTHASYNGGVKFLLNKLHAYQTETGQPLSGATAPIVFMVASHNRDTVLLTIEEMERNNVLPRSGVVHFGQLYGMQDQLSYTLGRNGYSTYKYLPYGMINEVIPYLLRRAQENSSVLGGVTLERQLMWKEVKDRLTGATPAPVSDVSISAKTA